MKFHFICIVHVFLNYNLNPLFLIVCVGLSKNLLKVLYTWGKNQVTFFIPPSSFKLFLSTVLCLLKHMPERIFYIVLVFHNFHLYIHFVEYFSFLDCRILSLLKSYSNSFFVCLFVCFSRQGFSITLEPVLELALIDQDGLKLKEIHLSLPSKCWD